MSSVLETFFIHFDTDTSKLKKGGEDATKTTNQLENSLNSVDHVAAHVGHSFLDFAKTAAGALVSIFAIEHVFEQSKAAVEYAEKITRLSMAMGANVEDVSAWSDAIRSSGGNSDAFEESIQSLTERMVRIETVGKGRLLPLFKAMGVDLLDVKNKGKTALDFLPQFAKASEKMSKTQSFGLLRNLGLDKDTILLVQKGGKAVDDLIKRQKELGTITEEDGEALKKFNQEQSDFGVLTRNIYLKFGEVVLPILDDFLILTMKVFASLKEHKGFVIGFFSALTAIILYNYLPAVIRAAIATWALIAPYLLIIATVALISAAIGLLVDDIMNWVNGNDSAIGRVLGSWKDFKGAMSLVWLDIKTSFANMWADMKGEVQKFLDWILSKFAKLGEFYDGVKGLFGLGNNSLTVGSQALSTANSTPLSAQTSNSIVGGASNSKSSTVKIDNVNVQTQATDAEGISKAIGGTLNDHMRNAQDQADDGIW